jgi:hypothetical protein
MPAAARRCGLAGQFACDALPNHYGAVLVKSLPAVNATAAFQLSVGRPAATPAAAPLEPDALFLTYKDADGTAEDLALLRRPTDPAAAAGSRGAELAPPPGRPGAVLRVSLLAELTGGLVELGRGPGAPGGPGRSHIFLDGLLDSECPFVLAGAGGGGATRVCLEPPTAERALALPDASGVAITTGNRQVYMQCGLCQCTCGQPAGVDATRLMPMHVRATGSWRCGASRALLWLIARALAYANARAGNGQLAMRRVARIALADRTCTSLCPCTCGQRAAGDSARHSKARARAAG